MTPDDVELYRARLGAERDRAARRAAEPPAWTGAGGVVMTSGYALPPVSDHEVEILRAVAAGVSVADLYARSDWDPDEVSATLLRHGLAVTEGGSVVPAVVPSWDVLEAALVSESAVVRRQAARTQAMMQDLARKMAADAAGGRARELRKQQRESLLEWARWLPAAQRAVQVELGRLLTEGPPRRGGA
jgi:hypothetical protein